jgi:hypothetical protein
MALATTDPDQLLVAAMTEPPPLEQARSSLEYWTRRRASLPVYKRSARREADEMIRRCRQRVAEAERRRYGTGLLGLVRRVLAGDGPSWPGVRTGLVVLVWALVPRRLVLGVAVVGIAWLLVAILALVGIAQLLS